MDSNCSFVNIFEKLKNLSFNIFELNVFKIKTTGNII